MITLNQIIDDIIRRESSKYTNNPSDRGGPTKYGITLVTLAGYRKSPVSAADVEALTEPEARDIYSTVYGAPFQKFPGMADSLLGLLVDSAVQHGAGRAMRWLQAAIGVKPDGDAGPTTMAAWSAMAKAPGYADAVYKLVLKRRIKFYAAIIHDDPTQATFANGWADRVCEFI
jgi:lysozyme family protein